MTARECWANCGIDPNDAEVHRIDVMEDALSPLSADLKAIRRLITSLEACHWNFGENPAICATWLPGRPLWDPLTAQWSEDEQTAGHLLAAVRQLAVFHDFMKEFPMSRSMAETARTQARRDARIRT